MDTIPRLNYIYQIAHKLLKKDIRNKELVRYYIHELKISSQKLMVRLHPDIKRSICKKCCSLLIPGITSTVRSRGKRNKHIVVTCNDCGLLKRFNTKEGYSCWPANPEAYITKNPPAKNMFSSKKCPKKILEVCVDSVQSAIIAQKSGASRLELCSNLMEGGTTPSIGMLKIIKKHVKIPVFCMIRPRGGDFLYSDLEYETMIEDITELKKNGSDGFVFGILKKDGYVDIDRCSKLLTFTHPLPNTFHRAFDMTKDWKSAMESIIILGFSRVLTSGYSNTVIEGSNMIKDMIGLFGNKIIIMPGGGITVQNISQIIATGAKEFHGTFRSNMPSQMDFLQANINMSSNSLSEYLIKTADEDKICEVVKELKSNVIF